MAKLRALKNRDTSTQTTSETRDLRGFEDSDLFHKTGVTIHLVVSDPPREEIVRSLCAAYHLAHEPHPHHSNAIQLASRHQVPGEHKKQALALFFAALEIHHHAPKARLLLHHQNGLHHVLHERIQEFTSHEHKLELLDIWHHSRAVLCVDGAVGLFLTHAGIEIPSSEHLAELHAHDIEKLHKSLESAAHSERKVG